MHLRVDHIGLVKPLPVTDTASNIRIGKEILNTQLQFYALAKALYTEDQLHEMLVEFELENPEETG